VNKSFRITIEINGNPNEIKVVSVPQQKGLELKLMSNSSNVQTINNKIIHSVVYGYDAVLKSDQIYYIDPFEIQIKDKIYQTRRIQLKLYQGPVKAATPKVRDKYYLQVQLSRKNVYVHEPLIAKVVLYATQKLQTTGYDQLHLDETAYFESLPIDDPFLGKESINNQIFYKYVIEIKRFFIALPGIFTLKPGKYNLSIHNKKETLVSQEQKITVRALPVQGKPDLFIREIVGSFQLARFSHH
jgi:hypothetical protein